MKLPHRDSARPLQEARLLARLDHPGIATIFEIGRRADGTLYSVHRFVRAERGPRSLREAFTRTTTLEERLRLLPRLLQACEAMGYAHGRGIVHRDLKPDHIALGDGGETVVLDWGLARSLDDAPDQRAVGTKGYWSPEQERGEPAGPAADVFALGVILAELLSVAPPAQRPRPLVAIADRAREEDPSRRYATAAALADDLTAWLSGGEVAAHAYALSERLALQFRRHRQALAFLCVIAVIAVAAAVQTARSRTRAQEALATSLLQKASQAQERGGWDEAAAYSAAARELADTEPARMSLAATAGRSRLLGRTTLSPGPLSALALAHAGGLLAIAVEDGDIALLARGERTPRHRLRGGHRLRVASVAFSPDDSLLYSAGADGRVVEWQLASGQARLVAEGKSEVNALAVSLRGDWLATAHEDGRVERRALPSGELLIAWQAHATPVYALELDPAGTWLATGAWSGEIVVWNGEGGQRARLEGHGRAVSALASSPDGTLLASASRDQTVRIWPTRQAGAGLVVEGHTQRVAAVGWLDDEHLQSTGDDGQVRTWAIRSAEGRAVDWQCIGVEHLGQAAGALVRAGDDTLLGGEEGALFRLGRPRVMTSKVPWRERVSHLDADDAGVLMIESLSFVRRDLTNDEVIARESTAPVQPAQVRLLPGGRRFWAGYRDGHALLFLRDAQGHDVSFAEVPRVWSLELDPDRRWGAALGGSPSVQLRSMSDGAEGPTLRGHESDVFAASLGRTLAVTGSYDSTLGVYALPSGERTLTLRGHWHGVRAVDLSPGELRIASGSWDKTVRLWNARTGEQEAVLRGHQTYVSAVRFSPSGKRLASASWDGALVIWDVATHAELLRQEHAENGPRTIEWFGEDVLRIAGTRMTRVDLSPGPVDLSRGVRFDGVNAGRVDFGLAPLD
jgi:WD40 repeat protein